MLPLPAPSQERISSLDGLRALSILLVIAGHAYQGATGHSADTTFWLIFGNAGLGVEVFFVISGFIITTLLLAEHKSRGAINLRNFYLRRFFRIVPPLWLYVLAVLVLASLGTIGGVSKGSVLSAITLTSDYSPYATSSALVHTWSLSVEEQFYLIWPLVLATVLIKRGEPLAMRVALTLIALAPAARVATNLVGNQFLHEHVYYMLHTRMDALMFGCLLSLLVGTAPFEKFLRWLSGGWIALVAAYVLLASPLLTARFGGAYLYTIGYSIEAGLIALILIWLVRHPRALAGRVLNSQIAVHAGLISYSLYLWQELLFKSDLSWSHGILGGLCLLPLFAEMSYRLIELPFSRIGRRFRAISTPSIPSP